MTYLLRKLGNPKGEEISKTEFEEIHNAKQSYSRIIRVEECFDAVIEDYVELEETILHYGVRHLAFSMSDHFDFQRMRNVINRRLLHLLSTARLYRYVLLKNGKPLATEIATFRKIEERLKDSDHQPIEFRIVEALRNYSQHHDFPISGMTQGARWESDGSGRKKERAAFSITVKIDGTKIATERSLAPAVKAALLGLGPDADVIVSIRKYIEHLGSIHSEFRRVISRREDQSLITMREALARGNLQLPMHDGLARLVYATSTADDGSITKVQIFDEFFSVLDILRKKNVTQANLSKRYVQWSGNA